MERVEAAGVLDLGALAQRLAYFCDRCPPGGTVLPRFEALRLNGQGSRMVERALRDEPAEIATALMLIVYRLRNSFFHGKKWNDSIHKQRENFRTANQILMASMDMHRAESDA